MVIASAALLLFVAQADKPPAKIHIDKIELPTLPQMPKAEMPKAEGLSGQKAEEHQDLKRTGGSVTAAGPAQCKVQAASHARSFIPVKNGYKPQGTITELRLPSLPARLGPFKTCLRLKSEDGHTAPIEVKLKGPGGQEILSSEGEVSFSGPGEIDFVIDWAAFETTATGDYTVSVSLDGGKPTDFTLPVKGPAAKP